MTAPTSTSTGVWPSSSRSIGSCTPRMCTRSSTRRFRIAAWRPAARRKPAASDMTTNEKIRAIAKSGEASPKCLPITAVRPMTIALWLLGIPPVSARTRRLRLLWRTDVNVTLATWQIVQARIGATRYLNSAIVRRGRRLSSSAPRGGSPRRPEAASHVRGQPPARRAGLCRRPGARLFAQGPPAALRRLARSCRSSHGRGDAAQDAVDESTRLVAREGLGELYRFVDRGLGGHASVDRDLVHGDPEHDPVDLGHLLELPVIRRFAEDGVELRAVGEHAAHELARKSRDVSGRGALGGVVVQDLLGIVVGGLQLEQDFQRQLPGLVAFPQAVPP